jgi:hypothetical protein
MADREATSGPTARHGPASRLIAKPSREGNEFLFSSPILLRDSPLPVKYGFPLTRPVADMECTLEYLPVWATPWRSADRILLL